MMKTKSEVQISNFGLKDVAADFFRDRQALLLDTSVSSLEKVRAQRSALPASKSGLEVICGASCDTGAQ